MKADLLDKAEAAAFLGVTRATLDVWIERYKIPFVKKSRFYLFDKSTLSNLKNQAKKWCRA